MRLFNLYNDINGACMHVLVKYCISGLINSSPTHMKPSHRVEARRRRWSWQVCWRILQWRTQSHPGGRMTHNHWMVILLVLKEGSCHIFGELYSYYYMDKWCLHEPVLCCHTPSHGTQICFDLKFELVAVGCVVMNATKRLLWECSPPQYSCLGIIPKKPSTLGTELVSLYSSAHAEASPCDCLIAVFISLIVAGTGCTKSGPDNIGCTWSFLYTHAECNLDMEFRFMYQTTCIVWGLHVQGCPNNT